MIKTLSAFVLAIVASIFLIGQVNAIGFYNISGRVKYPSGVTPNTQMIATNNVSRFVTAIRPDGTYTFYSLESGKYTIIPNNISGWVFNPKSHKVTLRSNIFNINFTAKKR